jgi:WXG100 family type VII secretion target
MTVSLTPAEAEAKIQQIHDARDQAVSKLNQISDTQEQMLASSWRGTSAGSYGNTAQQQREEFDQLITTLNDIVEKGSEHMRSVANLDQG